MRTKHDFLGDSQSDFVFRKIFLGRFLTDMTFHSIHVEFYMTKISFLTAFLCVCLRARYSLAYFHVEQYSTDFVLCLCEREKKPAVCLC